MFIHPNRYERLEQTFCGDMKTEKKSVMWEEGPGHRSGRVPILGW